MTATFYPDKAEAVLNRMRDGALIVDICDEPGMPGRATVYRWRTENADFRRAFTDARDSQCHCIAEDAVRDARLATNDWQGARLRFDAARWLVSKILPHVFGDKVAIGGDPDGVPVVHIYRFMTTEADQLARHAREKEEQAARARQLAGPPTIEPDPADDDV